MSCMRSLAVPSSSRQLLNRQDNQPSGTEDICFHFARHVAPNILDLNPVDYRIIGEMQQRLYQTKFHGWLGAKHDQ